MWTGNSGGWPQGQWPLQQSAYQNIPHEQVDWAALAQQWIRMKDSMSDDSESGQPPPSLRPPSVTTNTGRPFLPRNEGSLAENSFGPQIINRNIPSSSELVVQPNERESEPGATFDNAESNWNSGNSNNYWQPSWNSGSSNWVPPQASGSDNQEPSFEFGRNHGNQGYGVQSYNYNHGSDQFYFNQAGEQSSFNPYWPQGNSVNPPFLRGLPKDRQLRGESPTAVEEETVAPFNLDSVKCKNLPAWIREGLEKMDRDKQKKIERERMLQEREERLKKQQEEEEQMLREMEASKGSAYPLRKSKFESESEDEDSPHDRYHSPSYRRSVSPFQRKTPSPILPVKTEQEKLEEMMAKVRRILTEVLLEVTDEEISVIAKDIYNRERIKAPAQQLAKSSALASITGSLGLGDYGTDSESSGAEDEKGKDSELDSEENVEKRKAEFAEREKKISAAFKNNLSDDSEDDIKAGENEKSKPGDLAFMSMITSDSGRERYHFEKKYAEIPGILNTVEEAKVTSTKPSGNGGGEESKTSSAESSHSISHSDSESSSQSSRKRKSSQSESKEKRGRSKSASRSPEKNRRTSKRDSIDVDEKSSNNVNKSRRTENESKSLRRRKSRSNSRDRKYRRSSDSRHSSRRRSNYRRHSRTRYRRDSKRSRSRSRGYSSKSSSRSKSREPRKSRRSYSRSPPSKRENKWAGKK